MNGLDILILYMANQIGNERSIAGCFHILQGKRSGQAIQDAALFGLNHFFGLLPDLDRSHFNQIVQQLLEEQKLIYAPSPSKKGGEEEIDSSIVISTLGEDFLISYMNNIYFQDIVSHSPKKYNVNYIGSFWKKLKLLAQIISYSLHDQKKYAPIIADIEIQLDVKQLWGKISDKDSFIKSFVDDVYHFLEQLPLPIMAQIFVDRLNGYQVAGRTLAQMSKTYQIPEAILRLYMTEIVSLCIQGVEQGSYASLRPLLSAANISPHLTKSTQVTYQLLKKGKSLQEISHIRNLKQSTIEDHVVEIAINDPRWGASYFLTKEQMEKINNISNQYGTKKTSLIAQALNYEVSYFHIRLALLEERGES